ncbi:hypothetical protein Q671_16495 [Halomonas sp. PBN3]|nr:hypothetical protein Q671_16495 [Halomonas sp. PBN3]
MGLGAGVAPMISDVLTARGLTHGARLAAWPLAR